VPWQVKRNDSELGTGNLARISVVFSEATAAFSDPWRNATSDAPIGGEWDDRKMQQSRAEERSFRAKIEGAKTGRVYLVLPFDPENIWGKRTRYHVRGTINGTGVRGGLEKFGRGYFLPLGPAYGRGAGLNLGDVVMVKLVPEGPQSEALAPDITGALAKEPEAVRFFDGLATFYRKNYLRWIDATKRSPETRAQRIAELVRLMKAGQKQRPGGPR
jgi:hypothetical protein